MTNDFTNDINEIKQILSTLYPNNKKTENQSDIVIERLTSNTDSEYLNLRGEALKVSLKEEYRLSNIYKDFCANKVCFDCPLRKYCNNNINSLIENYDKNAPVMVDLFCGAGGLSLGFTQEGFVTSLANDIEPCCIETYSHNHPETPRENIVLGDINGVIENISSLLRFKKVDVVVGGPPCQGFSMANRQRVIDDPRNVLYKSYVKVVEIVKPRFFVMENVKGMYPVSPQVIEDFNKIGYDVSCRVFNAKNYGVPQNRERLIFVGNCVGKNNDTILNEIDSISANFKQHVLKDALLGLRPLVASRKKNDTENGSIESGFIIEKAKSIKPNDYINLINQGKCSKLVFNHKARYNNDRDIEIFGRLNPGDKSDDPKIADIMPYARRNDIFKDKYYKLDEDSVCKTITAHMKFDCNMYIHPTQARGLTPREAARVQSFPDDYFFKGAYTKTYMQIGNSVPPLLGRAIAKILKKHLTIKE